MNGVVPRAFLKILSVLLLVLSLGLLLAVSERSFSAVWQWYKFIGYETDGVITLSRRTSLGFAVVAVLAMLSSAAIGRMSQLSGVPVGARLSKWALLTTGVAVAAYCILAFSPLNSWRL